MKIKVPGKALGQAVVVGKCKDGTPIFDIISLAAELDVVAKVAKTTDKYVEVAASEVIPTGRPVALIVGWASSQRDAEDRAYGDGEIHAAQKHAEAWVFSGRGKEFNGRARWYGRRATREELAALAGAEEILHDRTVGAVEWVKAHHTIRNPETM